MAVWEQTLGLAVQAALEAGDGRFADAQRSHLFQQGRVRLALGVEADGHGYQLRCTTGFAAAPGSR